MAISYIKLSRIYISLFAALTTVTGFFLNPHHTSTAVISALAVFLLACGASSLNQYQERDLDAKMERTRRRPLPSGLITPARVLCFSLIVICSGELILLRSGENLPCLLGIIAVLLYNGIYTPLKKITAFAFIPGAAVGMIPPAIGWVTAGGTLYDPRLIAICFILFMWQIPHFLLLVLRYAREFHEAGIPSLAEVLSSASIVRVIFIWIFASSVTSLLLPLYNAVQTLIVYFTLFPLAAWLLWKGGWQEYCSGQGR